MSFSTKKSQNTNTTNNTSETNYTDNSANAGGEGSIAVGQGASLQIVDVSDRVAETSINAARDVAALSIAGQSKTAEAAIAGNSAVSNNAVNTTGAVSVAALNTVQGLGKVATEAARDSINAQKLAAEGNAGLTAKFADLTASALERSQTPDSQVTKTLLYVVGVVVAVVAFIFIRSNSTTRKAKK